MEFSACQGLGGGCAHHRVETVVRAARGTGADVVNSHYSAMSCHMMNMAYREESCIGWRQEWDV